MTITAEQLDELERRADSVPWMDENVIRQLVAVYRAALLVDTAIPDTLHEVQAHRMLRKAIRGEP